MPTKNSAEAQKERTLVDIPTCLHLILPFFLEIKYIQERHKWCSKTLSPRTPCRNFAYTSIWPQLRAWMIRLKSTRWEHGQIYQRRIGGSPSGLRQVYQRRIRLFKFIKRELRPMYQQRVRLKSTRRRIRQICPFKRFPRKDIRQMFQYGFSRREIRHIYKEFARKEIRYTGKDLKSHFYSILVNGNLHCHNSRSQVLT